MGSRRAKGAGRARAAAVLRRLAPDGSPARVGRVRHLGGGLDRVVYVAGVSGHGDDPDRVERLVVLLQRDDATSGTAARTLRQAALLDRLADRELPFEVPRVLGVIDERAGPALVETPVGGLQLDLRTRGRPEAAPWRIVASVAAGVHRLDPSVFGDLLPGHATRRAHALARLGLLAEVDTPVAREALTWGREHSPPDEPARLLHGDLLGQNILVFPGERPGLIDWDRAELGDPAYDLAIVTRGARRPFQQAGGLELLLEAYAEAGGAEVTSLQVHLHELALVAGFILDLRRRDSRSGALDQEHRRLASVLRRAEMASRSPDPR